MQLNMSAPKHLLCAMLSLGTAVHATVPVSYFTLIGDSLSDAGTADYAPTSFVKYTGISPDTRFYYDGRFTDGPTWGDVISNKLHKTQLRWFAVGYATACKANGYHLVQPSFPEVPSGQELARAYISAKALYQTSFKGWVGIWLGANDFGTALLSKRLFNETEVVIRGIISCVVGMTQELLAGGEHNIIVFSVPPLEHSPFVRNYKDLFQPLRQAVRNYNDALRGAVAGIKGVHYLDVYSPLKKVLTGETDKQYGITIVDKPCIQLDEIGDVLAPVQGSVCSRPSKYAWFDPFHLTSVVHQRVIAPLVMSHLHKYGGPAFLPH